MPKKQKNNKRIIIFSLLGLVIVAAGTFGVLALVNSENNEESRNADHETAIYDENDPNKDNPDKYTFGDDRKDELDDETTSENEKNNDGSVKATIYVNNTVVDDDKIVASANITNLVEENGTCTYTFTAPSGKTQVITAETLPSPYDTPCADASIAKSETGEWKLKVTYESTTASGESESLNFSVK